MWAASLREIKKRIRPLFGQERVAKNAGLFLEGLLGEEQRKTGWMRVPSRRSETSSSGGDGAVGLEAGVAGGQGERAETAGGDLGLHAEVIGVGGEEVGERVHVGRAVLAGPDDPGVVGDGQQPPDEMGKRRCRRRAASTSCSSIGSSRSMASMAFSSQELSKAVSTTAAITASLSGKTRKMVPSAMPAASAIWRVGPRCRAGRRAAAWP